MSAPFHPFVAYEERTLYLVLMNATSRNDAAHQGSFFKISKCQIKASLRFGLASLMVYATVAFGERWMYLHLGFPGAYGVWTLLFVVLGGLALKPLVVLPKAKRTFWLWFALAFIAYACSWMASYFTLRASAGEWLGSLLGSAALGLVVAMTFGSHSRYLKIAVELFVAHSAGYFLGEWLHHSLHGKIGMLLWGVCYGLGFGLGLARALYWAQTADTLSSP